MNSFIEYIPESLNDHKAFVELLLSIIDTKLQYVKHRTNTLISSYKDSSVFEENNSNTLPDNFSTDINATLMEGELVFTLFERCSKNTNLLMLLRAKLTEHNVSLVYDLLNNDQYLDYENEVLEQILENN